MSIILLDKIKEAKKRMQEDIEGKLANNGNITDYDTSVYELSDEDAEIMDYFVRSQNGETVPGFNLQDFLGTPQAKVLIPRVLIGTMRKAQEPYYVASEFFKKVRLKNSSSIILPSIGVMKAHDIPEGAEIPAETLDWQKHKNKHIYATKSGIRLQYSEDTMKECEFDLLNIMVSEAGRALVRHAEQKAFIELLKHGHPVFDNALRAKDPKTWAAAGTTGMDFNGNFNDTLSIDDLLDICIAILNNEYTPTDMVIHSLAWTAFAKSGLTGAFTALKEKDTKAENPVKGFKLGPESMQGRLPFSFNVKLSPFAPINKKARRFDTICVDKNNVGVKIIKYDLKTEEFRDPARDIQNLKMVEAYGYGTYNEGRAVALARNISMARSWAYPDRVVNIQTK
ncbi:putative major head protein (plasmid) [Clostridium baratii str. Sullivan]|uniref:Putative major head protein n=1 Tax=Clostridium baratii str. Sullivan TaxID=1415775 RepID=A0A0A7G2T6_9CLOT|nr:hypothetical protein [Clostridium baratii]AIY85330.1 putative major head protein [Clostridium baratii str. Sullivan]